MTLEAVKWEVMKPRSLDRKSLKPQKRELGAEKDLVKQDTTETTETMTEERQAPKGICLLQSMLNRIKSSAKLQDPSHVTAQHCRHGVDTNQCDDLLIAELDKPKRNFEKPDHSECSDKPELEYFTYRTVVHESNPTYTTISQRDPPCSLLHNVIKKTWHNLQTSEGHPLLEEVKEKQASQAKSDFSILNNSPPHELFTHKPSGSSDSDSEHGLVKETTVKKEHDIMKQSCWRENTVTSVEEAGPPPLPPKQRNFNQMHVQLQRTFTLNDFRLDLEPINLLEEVCTGDEWARFLPVINPSAHPDAKDDSQREDSHNSSDDIGPCNAVIKLARSADKEQSEISSSLVSVTDSQIDSVIQTRQETSPKESPFSDLPKTPQKGFAVAQMPDLLEYEQLKENYFMVVYVHDKTDLPLDLSVVKSTGILDNSALKSRILLNNKRKHQPPGKRKRGNIKLLFLRKRSASTTASTQSPTSSPAVVSFPFSKFYSLPESNSHTQQDFQTSVVANEKPLVTNTASLQMISEVTESYSNDNDFAEKTVLSKNDQLSIEAKLMDVHHDFSYVQSSRLLDNSALKDRINLSKKRKHRPPGKRKDENTKEKFLIKHVCQPSASKSHQSRPSSHASVFSFSAFYNIPCSKSKDLQTHEDSQTTVLGKEKTLVRNAAALSTILEVPECSSNDNDKPQLRDVPYDFSLVKSSELLDDSVLKYRISLGKKRKHRPPGKKKRCKRQKTNS